MPITIQGVINVKCNKCNKVHTLQPPSPEEWEIVESDEREMGKENNYEHEADVECSCGATIELRVNAWEYPEGVFSTDEYTVNGGAVERKWEIDFVVD